MDKIKKILDRLIPGSANDVIILLIAIVVAWFLFKTIGSWGLAALTFAWFQTDNSKKQAKHLENEYSKISKQDLEKAKKTAQEANQLFEDIEKIQKEEFKPSGKSNEEIVDNIRRTGF